MCRSGKLQSRIWMRQNSPIDESGALRNGRRAVALLTREERHPLNKRGKKPTDRHAHLNRALWEIDIRIRNGRHAPEHHRGLPVPVALPRAQNRRRKPPARAVFHPKPEAMSGMSRIPQTSTKTAAARVGPHSHEATAAQGRCCTADSPANPSGYSAVWLCTAGGPCKVCRCCSGIGHKPPR